MNDTIKIIIADDHPHEISGFADLLEFAEGITVIGKAKTAQQAVKQAIEKRPDVILLDMVWNRNQDEGVSAIGQIHKGASETRILVMTAYDEMIELAKRAGADKVIHKDYLNSKETLVEQIIAAYETRLLPKGQLISTNVLSSRELAVLELMCEGLSDNAIGSRLFISGKTVKKYATKIYRKLEVNNRTEATAFALRNRLVPHNRQQNIEN